MNASTHNPETPQATMWDDELIAELRRALGRQLSRHESLPVPSEDLISEALLRLLASDPRAIEAPHAYAATILRNLIRDKIRQLERARRLFASVSRERARDLAPRPDPDTVGDGDLLARLLSMTELTDVQQRVLQLMYFAGLTLSEVARELGKNPGTILRHHERAIGKLSRSAELLEAQR